MVIEEKASEMKVLLVQPRDEAMTYSAKRPLLGIAYLAAALDKVDGCTIKVLDMRLKDYATESGFISASKNFQPDIVAFTMQPLTVKRAFSMAKIVKETTSAYTIAGGPEVNLLPKTILSNKYIDFIMVGDGDYSFPQFITNFYGDNLKSTHGLGYKENGNLIINQPHIVENLDVLPFPAWDYFPLKNYNKDLSKIQFPIITSKGCPYRCAYCASSRTSGRYRVRSAKNIVDEMEFLYKKYGAANFQIVDDNFAVIKQRVFDFCDELIKRELKFKWSIGQGFGANHADYEMFKKMKEAGCYLVSIGVESADADILSITKKPSNLNQIGYAFESARKAGLITKANFICGLPGSTYKKEMESINLFKRLKVDIPRFGNIMVYPNTELYDWVKKNAKVLVDDLDDAHNQYSETTGTLNKDDSIKIIYETEDFPKEERIKAYKRCVEESEKWSLQLMFGKPLGYTAWQFSKIPFIREFGEKLLSKFGRI